jgi:FtsH-binding integral membrane protein
VTRSIALGVGFARYAELADASGLVLDSLSTFGLWSMSAVLVLVAALPPALGRRVTYSYAITFGAPFGAVSVIGIVYVGTRPSQLGVFGYAALIGIAAAIVLGTIAGVPGVGLNRAVSPAVRGTRRRMSKI